ncbi:SGNH/GDSL hydrolase family protein [Microbacterium lacticum]
MARLRSASPRRLPLVAAVALAGGAALVTTLVATGCTPEPSAATPVFSAPSPTPAASSHGAHRLRVVTIGDSLMSGYGLDLGQAWPTTLAGKAHVAMTSLACGGMGFVVSGDCGTPYSGLVPALAALQPDIVVVESSSNDFGENPDDVRAQTLTTVEEMHDAAPGARIFGLSTIWNDDTDVPDEVGSTSDDLSVAISLVDGTFLDVGQPLAGHPHWMQDDGVHPTARGQEAIAQTVLTRLTDAHWLG